MSVHRVNIYSVSLSRRGSRSSRGCACRKKRKQKPLFKNPFFLAQHIYGSGGFLPPPETFRTLRPPTGGTTPLPKHTTQHRRRNQAKLFFNPHPPPPTPVPPKTPPVTS